ncbi:hypothetical protein A2154_01945 [Candidatus Gottesmanbacteria bacterium RBG_16_43_7]|uniref:Lactamase n=1 Tax=Candidatus Gottesmanbacteria bacterium RBG_16_43_7 TaxID=1798373 RepID=A0A1F5Z933_9BACT|nr:MAG: hypothetical protein A2154_01945 [Candidatus Gottesmanbacteria bacterium RBG_16_43_7]
MEIKYFGHASFFIKGKTATVLTDPFNPQYVGIKLPKNIESDIITVSHEHEDHNNISVVAGAPFIVRGAGEYEIKNISIIGISVFHDAQAGAQRGINTIYKIEMDGLSLVHLGDLGHILPDNVIDALGNVDVLFIPVGGVFTINPDSAVKVIADIEPSLVIPMHYRSADQATGPFAQLATLADFLRVCGIDNIQKVSKATISKDKLPDETQIITFE